jgi:hypothetical protein
MLIENHRQAALYPLLPRLPHALPIRQSGALAGLSGAAVPRREPLAPSRFHPELRRREVLPPRCSRKGCVFPAQRGGHGECEHHHLESLEPACFESQQPTYLLLDQARFGLPDTEPDDGRVQDRHRLAEERVRFMLDEAV